MQSHDRFLVVGPHVIGEVIDGEAIVVNLESGAYYSLQGAGSLVWTLVCAGQTRAAIAAGVAGHYAGHAGEIAAGVDALLQELVSEGLIEVAPDTQRLANPSPMPQVGTAELSDFVPPVLTKYTDMADLLLLDPIHDVSQIGWPHPAPRQGS